MKDYATAFLNVREKKSFAVNNCIAYADRDPSISEPSDLYETGTRKIPFSLFS